ncbi:5'-nucleotidase C-terminal domain-containing protein [Pedobacter sp. BAL39]|uniref:5'-nucleotidase C-terminal domain-containing protein n=1 Tax=Pedobacter sp. BAL39 TaxID=391596 RepID=UPI0002D4839C|nr:5'-nucleotidase [Pedobacter sp. BAL39]
MMCNKTIRNTSSLIVFLPLLFLTSCQSSYLLTSSSRAEYHIDKDQQEDSSLIKSYMPYKVQVDQEMNAVIGHADVLMSKTDVPVENLLRNFFSDAMFHEALKYDKNIDFAMPSTKGGLRVDIPAGDIRLSNIFEVMPFDNEMMVFELAPADVENLLNFIASTDGQPVAGIRMRIVDGKPADVTIQGKPYDRNKNYRILTSDYLALGGDNVQSFKHPLSTEVLGVRMRDALVTYVKENQAAGKTINPKLDGRITKD